MLIAFSDSLIQSRDLTKDMCDDARDALVNLSTAVYEGHHVISCSPQTLGRVLELGDNLGVLAVERFRQAKRVLKDSNALKPQMWSYVEVQESGTPPSVVVRSQQVWPIIFRVGLDYFRRSQQAQAASMVGEDERDSKMYQALGAAMATRVRGFHCSLNAVAGGGQNTGRTFAAQAAKGPTLCIVDTDRVAPDAPLKETALEAQQNYYRLRAENRVADLHILPCHELENLLPEQLVLDALPPELERTHGAILRGQCTRLGQCDYVDLKEVFGGCSILRWTVDYVARISPHALRQICFHERSRSELREVGERVWSFGVASKPART